MRNPLVLVDGWKGSADQAEGMEFDCSFSSAWQKTNQKKTPVSRLTLHVAKPGDEAAPYAAMLCCKACSGAHNLAIAARLASIGALPDSMMLAASTG